MKPGKEGRPPVKGRPKTTTPLASQSQTIPGGRDTAQGDLLAYAQQIAESARDHGLEVSTFVDTEWVERVLEWIYDLAPGTELCAEDVRHEFGASPAMGSVFRVASKRRVIVAVGLKESTSPTHHKGLQRVWRRT